MLVIASDGAGPSSVRGKFAVKDTARKGVAFGSFFACM